LARYRLSDKKIANAKRPGLLADGGNLYLQVTEARKGVTKSWVFRFTSPVFGRPREMGLGPYPGVSLAEARTLASEQHAHLQRGDDPIEVRNAKRDRARAAAVKRMTFAEAAEHCIAARSDEWRSDVHRHQWRSTLATYAYPTLGKLPVDAIDLPHVIQVLEPIWRTKTQTASRLRARIERVLAWAAVRGYRRSENPARWRGNLEELLPKVAKVAPPEHHAALPLAELPGLMADLRQAPVTTVKAALEFTILTAARTGEAVSARWDEIDLANAIWSVPAERMKSGRPHRVPLSRRAVALLQSLPRDASGFVFPGTVVGKSISDSSLRKWLQTNVGGEATVHGFRSSFSDWARDRTAYSRDVVEAALAHVIRDKSEAAYRRGDALEKRSRLMEDWARFCEAPAIDATVTPLRRA
jgi:integrase